MEYRKLCKAVEKEVGRTLSAPSDFKWLSAQIEKRTHERLSPSTLMRAWGYMEEYVMPRRVTLNILARFIGYMGYDDFIARQSSDSVAAIAAGPDIIGSTSHPIASSSTSWRRWAIWVGAVLAVVLLAILGWFLFRQPAKAVYVTDLSQLSQNKQYYIHTRNKARGSLGMACRMMATTFSQAARHRCEEPGTFAIIEHGGAYYFYSVKDKRFIDYGQCERDEPLASLDCAVDIHQKADSCFVFDFKACKPVCSLNVNSAYGPHATNNGTFNEMYDDGNLFMLEEAGDFDPTEALAMLQERPDQEYEAALKSITPGRYVILASQSPRRLYLRADGYLTETLTDSCIFDISMVEKNKEGSVPYRLPAWCITHPSKDGQNATAFGTPQDEVERYVPRCGHLLVNASAIGSWQDKVLFLGENGCYAIRATNVPIESCGAGLYWTVYTPKGSKLPQADYCDEKSYVWKLKKYN